MSTAGFIASAPRSRCPVAGLGVGGSGLRAGPNLTSFSVTKVPCASWCCLYGDAMKRRWPVLIQGGMGVGVSNWRLAKAVSELGHLGVVSGVAADAVFIRRLQLGDDGGHVRRALAELPVPGAADRLLSRYFIEGGRAENERFKRSSMKWEEPSRNLADLLVAANFVEVFLAKEGHHGEVGLNLLEKIQPPTLPSLYGAMLAGVDYVLMGAGIPKAIPAVLDRLAKGLPAELKLDVKGAQKGDNFRARFDPAMCMQDADRTAKRPVFLAIVSSHILATMLASKIEVPVDGFIVEGPTAGGHNAPPRGRLQLSDAGEPIYGERDVPDLAAINDLGLPFWLAGSRGDPEAVCDALKQGATGVQIGTPFAYCDESGFDAELKRQVLEMSRNDQATVFTDPLASPSGFPFKVLELTGSLSEPELYDQRARPPCELGYLRHAYRTEDGKHGWRCPAEPVDDYVRKGGKVEDTVGRKCLCNALLANIGFPQVQREGAIELPMFTSGDSVAEVACFLSPGADSYSAADVIHRLLP
jgi:nitronate monooxygenase